MVVSAQSNAPSENVENDGELLVRQNLQSSEVASLSTEAAAKLKAVQLLPLLPPKQHHSRERRVDQSFDDSNALREPPVNETNQDTTVLLCQRAVDHDCSLWRARGRKAAMLRKHEGRMEMETSLSSGQSLM